MLQSSFISLIFPQHRQRFSQKQQKVERRSLSISSTTNARQFITTVDSLTSIILVCDTKKRTKKKKSPNRSQRKSLAPKKYERGQLGDKNHTTRYLSVGL
jgi:hypothetical protein